jgi:hypothetical protein
MAFMAVSPMPLAWSVMARIWAWKNSAWIPYCVLRVIGLDQLVAKVERRSDVALHEVRELLGVIGDRQLLGTQPLLQHLEIFVAALRTRSRFSVSIARTFSADITWSAMVFSLSCEVAYLASPPNQAPK